MSSLEEVYAKYQPTIGIECHVQLKTATKLFSGANNDARDQAPNTTVSPICFGFPGVLPVLNAEALTLAIRAGIALNADIPEISRFERKHYFYPDLPKGYQITQLAEPVIVGGYVEAPQLDGTIKKVRLHHAHLEEDAGKLTHPAGGAESFVDLNRAGTPLIEIVSEPDIHGPAEARSFAQELYRLMTYAGVTYGDLYHGNMRFDVNISLAPHGTDALGTRAEIKNLNSFRAVEKAAEFECIRQAEILDRSEKVVQETRGWNEDKQKTFSQRSKEEAHDYRYFPDADIPPVRISGERVAEVKTQMPVLPAEYRTAWSGLGLDSSVINTVLASQESAQLIAAIQQKAGDEHAKRVAHWFVSAVEDTEPEAVDTSPSTTPLESEVFIELSKMVSENLLSSTSAKNVFNEMLRTGGSPRTIAEQKNLLQVSDEGEIAAIVESVLAEPASQKAIEDIRSGNDKAIGYLVGQVMKRSQGKANPGLAGKLIRERL
jgi:aspartyl-tRNA(Asn)/glutamyl-tRNA(Gln) amidotransferase subunit B